MAEKFNDVMPCFVTGKEFFVAEVEKSAAHGEKNIGKLWLDSNWLTLEQARELRDWLNKAIP